MKRFILLLTLLLIPFILQGQSNDTYYIDGVVSAGDSAVVPQSTPLNGYYLVGIVFSDTLETADTTFFMTAKNASATARMAYSSTTGVREIAVLPIFTTHDDSLAATLFFSNTFLKKSGYAYPVLDAAQTYERNYLLIYGRD
jgi:hypothetical protein